jgi:superfamily II DNA/RNA helicase
MPPFSHSGYPMTDTVDVTFKDLNLPAHLLQALEKVGYEKPSPIQAKSIPLLLDGWAKPKQVLVKQLPLRCQC